MRSQSGAEHRSTEEEETTESTKGSPMNAPNVIDKSEGTGLLSSSYTKLKTCAQHHDIHQKSVKVSNSQNRAQSKRPTVLCKKDQKSASSSAPSPGHPSSNSTISDAIRLLILCRVHSSDYSAVSLDGFCSDR